MARGIPGPMGAKTRSGSTEAMNWRCGGPVATRITAGQEGTSPIRRQTGQVGPTSFR
jgi:hypothetical protein